MKKILKLCWIRNKLKNYDWIDFLWFNFIEISKRKISKELAKEIITPKKVIRVWIFLKSENKKDLDDIIKTAKYTNMNALQIHWDCDFEYLKNFWFIIINSMSYKDINSIKEDKNIDLYIIDWSIPWSWKQYDYDILNKLNLTKPFLIAWWINEFNLQEVLTKVPKASWVDLASWVDNGKNICNRKTGKIVNIIEKFNN